MREIGLVGKHWATIISSRQHSTLEYRCTLMMMTSVQLIQYHKLELLKAPVQGSPCSPTRSILSRWCPLCENHWTFETNSTSPPINRRVKRPKCENISLRSTRSFSLSYHLISNWRVQRDSTHVVPWPLSPCTDGCYTNSYGACFCDFIAIISHRLKAVQPADSWQKASLIVAGKFEHVALYAAPSRLAMLSCSMQLVSSSLICSICQRSILQTTVMPE